MRVTLSAGNGANGAAGADGSPDPELHGRRADRRRPGLGTALQSGYSAPSPAARARQPVHGLFGMSAGGDGGLGLRQRRRDRGPGNPGHRDAAEPPSRRPGRDGLAAWNDSHFDAAMRASSRATIRAPTAWRAMGVSRPAGARSTGPCRRADGSRARAATEHPATPGKEERARPIPSTASAARRSARASAAGAAVREAAAARGQGRRRRRSEHRARQRRQHRHADRVHSEHGRRGHRRRGRCRPGRAGRSAGRRRRAFRRRTRPGLAGGNGAGGSGGAGGTGGISVGILESGSTIMIDWRRPPSTSLGAPGCRRSGRPRREGTAWGSLTTGVDGNSGASGSAGTAVAVLSLM